MFDFAGSELVLIGIVALVLIGPKDLPVAMKAVSQTVKKARRMASEFQTHVDEMLRDADLKEVRDNLNELRRMDIKGQILKSVDGDGSLRSSLRDPLTDFSPAPPPVPVHDVTPQTISMPAPMPEPVIAAADPDVPARPVPAFIPPSYQPKPPRPLPPAFVPPQAAAKHAEHA